MRYETIVAEIELYNVEINTYLEDNDYITMQP